MSYVDVRKRQALGFPERAAGFEWSSGVKIKPLYELARILRAIVAVHAGILELYREGTFVTDIVESANNALPIDAAVTRRSKIPAAARIAVGKIRSEDAAAAVKRQRNIFDMNVENAIGKAAQEFHG